MASLLNVGESEFEAEVLKSDVPVLVDFWAPWCGPCLAIGPSVEEVANEYAGKAKVVKVNVDESPNISSEYGIMSIPALLVFKGGAVVDQSVGAIPKPMIAALLDRHV
jgi:thioredoxin 1